MADTQAVLKNDAWLKFLNKTRKNLKNVFPLLRVAVNTVGHRDINDHFRQERSPKGKWQRWSTATRESYARQGKSGNKILQDSGIHNYGKGKIPQREFMWLSGKAKVKILKIIMEKL